jgi:hypothetical protein
MSLEKKFIGHKVHRPPVAKRMLYILQFYSRNGEFEAHDFFWHNIAFEDCCNFCSNWVRAYFWLTWLVLKSTSMMWHVHVYYRPASKSPTLVFWLMKLKSKEAWLKIPLLCHAECLPCTSAFCLTSQYNLLYTWYA